MWWPEGHKGSLLRNGFIWRHMSWFNDTFQCPIASKNMQVSQDQGVSLQRCNERESWQGMQPGSFPYSRVGNSTESTQFWSVQSFSLSLWVRPPTCLAKQTLFLLPRDILWWHFQLNTHNRLYLNLKIKNVWKPLWTFLSSKCFFWSNILGSDLSYSLLMF